MREGKVEIRWDRSVFDGKDRLLPESLVLYTQVYISKQEAWSAVITFDVPPRDQGYVTYGKIRMLFDEDAPPLLKTGFTFDFLDGMRRLGVCRVIEDDTSSHM